MARKDQNQKHPRKLKGEAASGTAGAWRNLAAADSAGLTALVLSVFAFVFALISITSFLQKSPTVDEPMHLLSGYANLKWADYRANPEHPPLAKMWAAVPLVFLDVRDPRSTSPYWDRIPTESPRALHTVNVAAQLLFVDNDAENLFFYAKVMMVALAVVLGCFVFMWSREIFGLSGALASLFLYTLDPNILAHSQLVHTDLPFTTLLFIATYFYCRSLNRLSARNLALTALFFGLAAVTKYSYTVVLLLWALLGGLKAISAQPLELALGRTTVITNRWNKLLALSGIFACVLVTAYLFIWLVYGFRFDAVPGGHLRLPMAEELPTSPPLAAFIGALLEYRLFPEAWIYGQLHVYNNLARDTYLLGQMLIGEGSWLYFPVAFAVKTPLPTLLLFFGTLVLWFRERNGQRPESLLLVAIAVYFFLAVASGINIGLRHILPIYPFIFVLAGGTAATLWQTKNQWKRWTVAVLGGWLLLSTALTYPNYLAYFNELAGGSRNGHKILLDSNLDWGQDLKGLKRWMTNNRVQRIQFLYFGFFNAAAPRYYAIDSVFLPGSWVAGNEISRDNTRPPPYLAISANLLYGRFQGGADEEFVAPFRALPPLAVIGNSILVYQVEKSIEQYREIVRGNPDSAAHHFSLAKLLFHQGHGQEAVGEYRRAVEIDPNFAEAHNNLGAALVKLGAVDEAIAHLRRALDLKAMDNRHETQFQLGAVFAMKGNLAEAVRYFRAATETKPAFVPAHYNLGILSAAQGDMGQAILYFREVLRLDPEYAEAHVALARALAEQNEKEEAARHFQEAIRILKTRSPASASDPPRP
jgi:tetratricopeptide (TPR) repeat protein